MKNILILIIVFIAITQLTIAQESRKKIQVQIKHNNEVILDTTFYEHEKYAKETIENMVSKYSDDQVYINSENIHGLYVFDISKEKEENSLFHRNVEVNIDSAFDQFSEKLERGWEQINIEVVMDSIGSAMKNLKENLEEFDPETDPDFQEFKNNLNEMFEKIRSTRIVIIEDGDTIRVPKK